MFTESHYLFRRFLRFIALPYCYIFLVNWKECTKSPIDVFFDLLFIFFKFKYFPDNYSPCRLWEKDRSEWAYYYGSPYHPYARHKLRTEVQPYEHQIIFNDKTVTDLLINGLGLPAPRSYGVINPGDNLSDSLDSLFQKGNKNEFILKSVMGRGGKGIVLAINNSEGVVIKTNKTVIPISDFELQDTMFVQEIVKQPKEISDFSASSLNTIRILTLLTKSNEVLVISAYMRFGRGKSFVDNWSSGGVAVGVNCDTGMLHEFAYNNQGNKFKEHPDSKKPFKDFKIPMWDDVLRIACKLQAACTFYKFVGVDVALSKDGPVIIEANANSCLITQEQNSGPLFKNKAVLNEFNNYDLLVNDYQKKLLELDY